MSHNKITVGGQTPNQGGEISVSVQNLGDVSVSSLSANDTLQYNGSAWANVPTTQLSGGTVLMLGNGSSQNYSGTALGNNVDVGFYEIVYNGINATNITSASWNDSITLPAGSYHVNAVLGLTFTGSTGIATYRWHDGTSFFGTQGNVAYDTDTIGSSASGYISSASTINLTVRLNTAPTAINAVASQGTRQAEYGYVEIRKLG